MKTLIRLKEVQSMTGLARSTIYSYMATNNFPKQLKLGERCVAWKMEDVVAWINSKEYC